MFDGVHGWCQSWEIDTEVRWWKNPDAPPLSDADRQAYERRRKEKDRERVEKARKAAAQAVKIMGEAELVIPRPPQPWRPGRPAVEEISGHPYLKRKGFPMEPYFARRRDMLLPMFDVQRYGQPIGLQRIEPDGTKMFLPDQRSKGAVFRLGSGRARELWLCEGYATALSLRAALKKLHRDVDVLICFSAGNIKHVASLKFGTHVMADHDKVNPQTGTRVGEQAAIATGLPWVCPPREGDDANDLHQREGLEALVDLVGGCIA